MRSTHSRPYVQTSANKGKEAVTMQRKEGVPTPQPHKEIVSKYTHKGIKCCITIIQ